MSENVNPMKRGTEIAIRFGLMAATWMVFSGTAGLAKVFIEENQDASNPTQVHWIAGALIVLAVVAFVVAAGATIYFVRRTRR